MRDEWPLVGRLDELELIGRVLGDTDTRGLVLAGPAGVGKTRIGLEALHLAEQSGFATVRLLASRAASAFPLAALTPLLATGFSAGDPSDLLLRAQHAVEAFAAGRPLVALVDDAHLLDEASATLLYLLATSSRAFVIATIRTGETVPDPVTALWKEDIAERIEIGPLPRDEVGALLREVLGGAVDADIVDEFAERSQGNALFLRELVRAGLDSGNLRGEGGSWRLEAPIVASGRLAEIISDRLVALDNIDDRRALELVALAEPVELSIVTGVVGVESVEHLELADVVRIEPAERTTMVRLAHPLYGDVVRDNLPVVRARTIRLQLADALEAEGIQTIDDAVRVAMWRLDGGGQVDAGLLIKAARRANALGDAALSERLSRVALEEGGGFRAAIVHGRALEFTGRAEDAEAEWSALAASPLTDEQRVQLTGERLTNFVTFLGRPQDGLSVLAEQEALVTTDDSREALRIQSMMALNYLGRFAEVRTLLGNVADSLHGVHLANACYPAAAYWYSGEFEKAISITERSYAAHAALADNQPAFRHLPHTFIRAQTMVWAGWLDDAEALATAEYDSAVESGDRLTEAFFSYLRGHLYLGRGRVGDAVHWARIGVRMVREFEVWYLLGMAYSSLTHSLALSGELDEARRIANEHAALQLQAVDYATFRMNALGWIEACAGRLDAARTIFRSVAADAREHGDALPELMALHDLARLGWADEVADLIVELAPRIDGDLAAARADHATALAARDPGALDAASARFEADGAVLLAAEAAADAAVAWQKRGSARSARESTRRAATLRSQCQGAKTPALSSIGARSLLTSTELRVAALAAAGTSNRDIAEEMTLSVRTVEGALNRTYAKLGVDGRTELAAALEDL